jgi:hypothetical protein
LALDEAIKMRGGDKPLILGAILLPLLLALPLNVNAQLPSLPKPTNPGVAVGNPTTTAECNVHCQFEVKYSKEIGTTKDENDPHLVCPLFESS